MDPGDGKTMAYDELGWAPYQKAAVYVGDAVNLTSIPVLSLSLEDITALAQSWEIEVALQWR